jgi:hypothetical protein
MHGVREYIGAGGLVSYGANYPDLLRRAADFVARFCSGRTRAVEQPTKFDLADEVIE